MVIENGVNGLLTPTNDAYELSKKMLMIIENEELANTISLNAIKIKDIYNSQNIISQWKNSIINI